jgi:hypothetical protein
MASINCETFICGINVFPTFSVRREPQIRLNFPNAYEFLDESTILNIIKFFDYIDDDEKKNTFASAHLKENKPKLYNLLLDTYVKPLDFCLECKRIFDLFTLEKAYTWTYEGEILTLRYTLETVKNNDEAKEALFNRLAIIKGQEK